MTKIDYRERLREKILVLSTRIVAKDGLAALQARRVADAAGCSVGSVYNVFGDIDGLIMSVNARTLARLGADAQASIAATAGKPTEQRLIALAIAYMRFAFANMKSWKAVFEHRLPAGREPPPEYRADQQRLLSIIESLVGEEIADRATRVHAARALFAAVHGIVTLAMDNRVSQLDKKSVEAEIRFIVTAAANGMKAAVGSKAKH